MFSIGSVGPRQPDPEKPRMPRVSVVQLALAVVLLGGCSELRPGSLQSDVDGVTGPVPRVNTTPMQELLACVSAETRRKQDIRLGIAEFADGTGAMEGDAQNSRALTQRPDMMMTVALARGGMHLVNRNSIAVAEWELRNAIEKKLGEGRAVNSDNQRVEFRPVKVGSMLGSTHYVSGAITEINWNLSSALAEGGAYSSFAGRRTYRISVAVDVLVTNTITTEIVHARSYKKQMVGFEVTAGLFRFVQVNPFVKAASLVTTGGLELFSANLGSKQNEPVQTAVRWLIELAAYDIIRSLTSQGESCDQKLPPDTLDIKPARQSIVVANASSSPMARTADTSAARVAQVSSADNSRRSQPEANENSGEVESTSSVPREDSATAAAGRRRSSPALTVKTNATEDALRSGGVAVASTFAAEMGSAATEVAAREFRSVLQNRFADQLDRQRLDIVQVGGSEPYRVRISRLSKDMAGIVCFRIKVAGGQCSVVGQGSEASLRPSLGGRS